MSAQTGPRFKAEKKLKQVRRILKTGVTVYDGGMACVELSSGLLVKGAAATGLKHIGYFTEVPTAGLLGDGTKTVAVRLLREITARWFANDGAAAVTLASFGNDCFILDDQTVSADDDTDSRSVAGTVWDVSASKGVLVEAPN